jgi:hypothetical protein
MECEKPISGKVSLNENALNATQTASTLLGQRVKSPWTAVTSFLYLFLFVFLFALSLWAFFFISTSSFYLFPTYLSL